VGAGGLLRGAGGCAVKSGFIFPILDVSQHVFKDARLLDAMTGFFRVDCHHDYCQREAHFGKDV